MCASPRVNPLWTPDVTDPNKQPHWRVTVRTETIHEVVASDPTSAADLEPDGFEPSEGKRIHQTVLAVDYMRPGETL